MRFSLFFCIALNRKNEIRSGLQNSSSGNLKAKNCGRRKKRNFLQIKKKLIWNLSLYLFFSKITGWAKWKKKVPKNYGVKTRTKNFESKEGDKNSASKKAQKKSFPDFLSSITSISTRISNSKTFSFFFFFSGIKSHFGLFNTVVFFLSLPLSF